MMYQKTGALNTDPASMRALGEYMNSHFKCNSGQTPAQIKKTILMAYTDQELTEELNARKNG